MRKFEKQKLHCWFGHCSLSIYASDEMEHRLLLQNHRSVYFIRNLSSSMAYKCKHTETCICSTLLLNPFIKSTSASISQTSKIYVVVFDAAGIFLCSLFRRIICLFDVSFKFLDSFLTNSRKGLL